MCDFIVSLTHFSSTVLCVCVCVLCVLSVSFFVAIDCLLSFPLKPGLHPCIVFVSLGTDSRCQSSIMRHLSSPRRISCTSVATLQRTLGAYLSSVAFCQNEDEGGHDLHVA